MHCCARAWVVVVVAACGACINACINAATDERCDFDTDCHVGQICAGGACAVPVVDAGSSVVDAGVHGHDAGIVGDDAGIRANDAGSAGDDAGIVGVDDAGPGGCAHLEHDGGDGACVPLGQCSPGFARLFVDADGDGHGAGAQRDQCDPVPAASGLSQSGDDCDDNNGSAFTLVSGFVDGDDDAFTAGPVSACTDGSLPASVRATERLAPVLLVPTDASSSGGFSSSWSQGDNAVDCCGDNATFDLPQGGGDTPTLTLTGYTCPVQPQRVDQIRAHLSIGASFAFFPPVADVTAHLVVDGVSGAAVQVTQQTLTLNGIGDLALAGSASDWGFPGLSPSALCDGNTSLVLDMNVSGGLTFPVEVELDYAMLEVSGVNDCDDGDATVYARENIYVDADGDGESTSALAQSCTGTAALAVPHDTSQGDDCDDTDAHAHHGENQFFTEASHGGTRDYNCDGVLQKRSVVQALSCTDNGDGTCSVATSQNNSGECGQLVPADTCASAPPCDIAAATARVACK